MGSQPDDAIWKSIFAEYNITYENAEEFPNLMLKATIQSLSEMVVEKMKSDFDPAFAQKAVMADDGAEAGMKAGALISEIPADFWKDKWMLKSLDTSSGRDIIKSDIRTLKANIHSSKDESAAWRKDLTLFDTVEEDED